MDHGAPPWFNQGRPAAGTAPWRGMYPPPPVPHLRTNNYGYYQQPHMQGGDQAWHNQWVDHYHHHPANMSRPVESMRPASRAEIYERSERREPFRPLSRQECDERYGFYESVHRENYGNRDYPYDPTADVSAEKDMRRIGHYNPMENWIQNPPTLYFPNQDTEKNQLYNETQDRIREYGDNAGWQSDQRRFTPSVESFSSTAPSLLSQYRESGMSSSSYELSQYMHDQADVTDSWNPLQDETLECTPQPTAPMKFSLPHVSVCFGAQGQLVRVQPNFPDEGQPALVEIHSMEVILSETKEQEEMMNFPGPVQREDLHKVDIMNYCQQNASQCLRSGGPRSRDDALLWQVLLQMCRQNGCIDGTDVAELILQDCKHERYQRVQEDNDRIFLSEDPLLIPDGAQVDLLTGDAPSAAETTTQAVERFTKLLFFGRKKEALDWAMRSQLWGHALFLSSKMDSRTYSWVMTRFTSTLALNDPLQTLFQLMAGRIPQAATCCGDLKWGDWRPHLAVMLSNQMGDPEVNQRAIVTMGDHLVLKGFMEAGHCCFLTAGIPLGHLHDKSDRLVLLGSNQNQTFKKFASTAHIQRTEILEYCQRLGKSKHCIPAFQVYKFLYATRLLDYGLTSLALHYCECIASALLSSGSGSSVLISELIKLSERLRYLDPQILEPTEQDPRQELMWLFQLQALLPQIQRNNEESRSSPVICNEQGNTVETAKPLHTHPTTEVSDVLTVTNNLQNIQEGPMVPVSQSVAEERAHVGSWVPQYTDMESTYAQSGYNYEWSLHQSAPSTELSSNYNAYQQPMEQEKLAHSESPPQSSSNNDPMLLDALMNRRVSSVSDTSTVSVEDDEGEERSGDEASALKSEEKKGSTFRWFNWFRSKPAKETSVLPRNSQVSKPSSQAEALPRSSDKTHPPPLPSSGYLTTEGSKNLSTRAKGMGEVGQRCLKRVELEVTLPGIQESEDRQKINSSSVLPEIGGQQENKDIYGNTSVSGNHTNQPPGAVPMFNPSQFLQDTGRSINQPRGLHRGRYPQPPR
ncbi:protein transport protein Sec16B isoform X2 [Hyperolius riggenbachi]|uniref:protein transport protein Sec16B isoform X2 n=1 Tax=Hyperolius riggenbachi TaxID=752182 RepID=UPI0035A37515